MVGTSIVQPRFRSSKSVASLGGIEDFPFLIRLIQNGARDISPFLESAVAGNKHIRRQAQGPQNIAQLRHFAAARGDDGLDDEKVKVAILPRVASSVRAEEDDPTWRCRLFQEFHGSLDRLLG